jgi:5-methyltetrahydrofolate--homocysteine methyltransferase
MMLESAGFEVHNAGTETSSDEFIRLAKEKNADIVGLSALLTTTMTHMPEVIKAREEAGLDGKVKVLIGGAPVDNDFAEEIGADGYASDASTAVRVATNVLKK